ncbi:MAG TPA: DUF1735 domain-containing protein [Chryseosolibacter sp.]
MKLNITIKLMIFFLGAFAFTSCLEGDEMNTPPDGSKAILEMTNNSKGGTLVNSGIRYFGNQALLLNPTVDNDTMTFAVTLQGVASYDKDINVTLVTPSEALDDYYYSDSIVYQMMPSTGYTMLSTTGVIPKGQSYAEFKVVFHPSQINLGENYMLPITATNDANLPISSNYGYVYYHSIGNPIAGPYSWEFIRYSDPAATGSPDATSFSGESTVFAPINPTTVTVPTGYYTQPNYIISFKNTNGVLSNFTVKIDPDAIKDWATAGVVVATGPTILVENNNTKFTIKYTTLTRNCTDIYIRQ